jgi:hypothetical protein
MRLHWEDVVSGAEKIYFYCNNATKAEAEEIFN